MPVLQHIWEEGERSAKTGAAIAVMQENEFSFRIALFTPKDSLQTGAS